MCRERNCSHRVLQGGCTMGPAMRVELVPVCEEDKSVLQNLLQFYRYDLAEFRPYEITEHGLFVYRFLDHYFPPGSDREACFLRVDGVLAGFTMTRTLPDGSREVAEFFVMRAYRRRGVGREAARALFRRHPGPWTIAFDDANGPGRAFWPSIAAEAAAGAVASGHREPPDVSYASTWLRFRTVRD